jgi:hypothetical protein
MNIEFRNRPTQKDIYLSQRGIYRVLTVIVFITFIFLLIENQKHPLSLQRDPYAFALACMVILVYGFFQVSAIICLKKNNEAFTILWDDLTITRKAAGYTDIVLYHGEIQEMSELPKGSFFVKGMEKYDEFFIPPTIENRAQLRTLLEGLQPIGKYKSTQKKTWEAGLLIYAYSSFLLACFLFQENRTFIWAAFILNVPSAYFSFTNPYKPSFAKFFTALRLGIIVLLLISSFMWSFNY